MSPHTVASGHWAWPPKCKMPRARCNEPRMGEWMEKVKLDGVGGIGGNNKNVRFWMDSAGVLPGGNFIFLSQVATNFQK